jgi:fructokinase
MTRSSSQHGLRIGLDLGGSKIEGVLVGPGAKEWARYRVATPRDDYAATIAAIVDLTARLMQGIAPGAKIGIAVPGSISPPTGLMQNANSSWLNGRAFDRDLAVALATPVGTGCGGGLVVNGRLFDGPRGIGGEWGHNPLPWAMSDEYPGPHCWCGRKGCLETSVSGPGMAADHAKVAGETHTAVEIAARAERGNGAARATLSRHADRLARGLAHVVNIIDPDVLVLGGGLSNLSHLYEQLPQLMGPHIFADRASVVIKAPRWGDASGSRGAARLWDLPISQQ